MRAAITAALVAYLLMVLVGFGFQSVAVDPAGGYGRTWSFSSPTGATGTFYAGGFYDAFDDAATGWSSTASATFGTASATMAAHLCFVGSIGVVNDTLRVFGSSITDAGVLTEPDTAFVYMASADTAGQYYETPEKWLGTVTVERASVATNARATNVGFAKYWDNNNQSFTVTGVEVTGRGGATDTGFNVKIRHHRASGWTYNVLGLNAGNYPADIGKLATDHGTNRTLTSGEPFAWKRDNLSTAVLGGASEGVIFEIVTTANNAVESSNITLVYTQ